MKKLKEFFKSDLKTKNAGIIEYVFAIVAVFCVLPSAIIYLLLTFLIVSPVKGLVKKVWK
jgi:hypothetical protein|tara:strand:+ start:1796 stop:1975 length:180 start_codon:yes stop_codon:yes gene_type:complete